MTRTHSLLVLSFVTVLGGCNSAPAPVPTEAAETETAVAATAEPAPDGAPKIAADEAVFDFGAIKPTDKVEHVFKIKNAGTADLKIIKVQRT